MGAEPASSSVGKWAARHEGLKVIRYSTAPLSGLVSTPHVSNTPTCTPTHAHTHATTLPVRRIQKLGPGAGQPRRSIGITLSLSLEGPQDRVHTPAHFAQHRLPHFLSSVRP
jgi:hypothetical protein|eukprot:COSAG01_NODE_6312_length_3742_cov_16.851771_2_plen_112_part_00